MVSEENLDEIDDMKLLNGDDDEIEFDVDIDGDWDED
jgi:hypothetical protein